MNCSYFLRSIRFSSYFFCTAFYLAFAMFSSFPKESISVNNLFFSYLNRYNCCQLIVNLFVSVVISWLSARTLLLCSSADTHDSCLASSSASFFFNFLFSSAARIVSIEYSFFKTRNSLPKRSISSLAVSLSLSSLRLLRMSAVWEASLSINSCSRLLHSMLFLTKV